jgi:hypothetical protein
VTWTKAAASGQSNCVQVDHRGAEVHVRHSAAPAGPRLVFTRAEWDAFLAGAAAGEFTAPRTAG